MKTISDDLDQIGMMIYGDEPENGKTAKKAVSDVKELVVRIGDIV